MRYLAATLLAGAAVIATPLAAAPAKKDAKAEEKWSVEAPKGAVIKQVPISTNEGTWMDVDVAPDGQTAKIRSRALSIMGQYERYSQWMGGVYENDFVKENLAGFLVVFNCRCQHFLYTWR